MPLAQQNFRKDDVHTNRNEEKMTSATDADMQALLAELRNLRTDFAKVGDTLQDMAAHGTAETRDKIKGSAQKVWGKAKKQVEDVTEEIEANPVPAAFIAFGIGAVLGMLFSGRR
jgi:ElaB/YqjD/DUF883 family membrane-anchored ribosome-binding protein